MSRFDEQLTEQFHKWELRGRGWRVFDHPIYPEPPFRPFVGHYIPETPIVDDGRKPTFLSSFARKLGMAEQLKPPVIPTVEKEPEPRPIFREGLVELQTSLPARLDIGKEALDQFLRTLTLCREPVAFELVGSAGRVSVQFAASQNDAPHVRRQLQSYFPEAIFQAGESALEQACGLHEDREFIVVEFGLANEFMFSLATAKLDPFIGLIGAFSELNSDEFGLFQVIFQAAHAPWAESIINAVTHADGKPLFVNQSELTSAAENKVRHPLFAAVVRIATKAETYERSLEIARDMASSLRVFADPQGNELVPLRNDAYPLDAHIEDVIRRQSRRTGMLLSNEELIGFVHLPGDAVRSPILERDSGKTKAAPSVARQASGVLLGDNEHAGESIPVKLTPEQRTRHIHIIGASGTGKSTLLFKLICQDIESGQGVAVLDPHGDLVDRILGIIPPARIDDVVLVDPSDEEYSVGFNFLSAHSDLEKNLLASDLVSVFERLSTTWGDQMGSVFNNALLAFLESSRHGTLADLRRFLIEPGFRAEFLKTIGDPDLVYYWQKVFPQLSGNKSIGSVLTRLETFLAPKPIRYMVSQPENRLDFAQIMDTGKIFLAKLSQGLLGKENSYLLGTLLVSKFQQLAMSRQAQRITLRRDFWVYVDEFHNFISPSMAEILSGARKYRIGLTLAHQELRQLQRDSEVASSVMSNPYTRICFRVGDDDARKLADGFSFFEARDLQNLETGKAIARIERSDFDFNLSVPLPPDTDENDGASRREQVVTASRKKYAVPRAEVEALLRRLRESQPKEQADSKAAVTTEKVAPIRPAPIPEPAMPITPPPPLPPVVIPSETKAVIVSEKKTLLPQTELGRGGEQHKAIQQRIKTAAETFGFRSTIEKQILDGQGSIDLLLERDDQSFACEISISNTVDYEVGNVRKCLKAGYSNVVVICVDEVRLKKIAAAVSGGLGAEIAAKVIFCQPDKFIAGLKELPPAVPKSPEAPKTSRGYKVRTSAQKLTIEEQRQRDELLHRTLAEAMRKKSSAC